MICISFVFSLFSYFYYGKLYSGFPLLKIILIPGGGKVKRKLALIFSEC